MLRELRIQNFAIIDRLEICFDPRLNVLTGETGSGKSILVDAVDLLLGGRSSSEQIRTGSDEAILEAAFEVAPDGLVAEEIRRMDLAGGEAGELVIRRVLSRAGKGRATLNGSLVAIGQLQQIGNLLVDIHGQHEHQSLLRSEQQRDLLDAFGTLSDLRREYQESYQAYRKSHEELLALEGTERDRLQRTDLLQFQSQELQSADLQPGEDQRLEQERIVLSNAGRLSVLADEAYRRLYADDGAILAQLSLAETAIADLSRTDERMKDLIEICNGARAELQDAAERLRNYRDGIEHDPQRLARIEERFHLIQSLKKKYAPSLEGILRRQHEINDELGRISTADERRQSLASEVGKAEARCLDLAGRLTRGRIGAARQLEKKVEQELNKLKMTKTRFKIRFETAETIERLGPFGADEIEYRVAPNPGEEPKPLARIASGGELSRIMLSLKSILAAVDRVPTLVFDEVDAGIGGGVAEVVGQRLKGLARNRQVLCVTHLPQIASQAPTHFTVEKAVLQGRAVTRVKRLREEERVEEIARMLGGRQTTPAAFKHAREMLNLGAT